jgi:hypothetical protein
MNPLIDSFTNILKPCSGCQKVDLSDPLYDSFWEKKDNKDQENETDSTNPGPNGNG